MGLTRERLDASCERTSCARKAKVLSSRASGGFECWRLRFRHGTGHPACSPACCTTKWNARSSQCPLKRNFFPLPARQLECRMQRAIVAYVGTCSFFKRTAVRKQPMPSTLEASAHILAAGMIASLASPMSILLRLGDAPSKYRSEATHRISGAPARSILLRFKLPSCEDDPGASSRSRNPKVKLRHCPGNTKLLPRRHQGKLVCDNIIHFCLFVLGGPS